jgi:methylenetetrahydrofolate dehydrogenase (NADP+) / methenyltetrahydrofolate cyclohydrolase
MPADVPVWNQFESTSPAEPRLKRSSADVAGLVRGADIVVAAVGKPRFVRGDWIRPGAVVVDAGYHPGNVGDVDLESAARHASAYTPVPGGVGPMTIATLLDQTATAAERAMASR